MSKKFNVISQNATAPDVPTTSQQKAQGSSTWKLDGINKFIHHLDHIKKIKDGNVTLAPIHISIWPTIKCQFKCSYCCCKTLINSNNGDLNFDDFKNAVDVLIKYGTKAFEFSGGGEPAMWAHFEEAVSYIHGKGRKVSLITNGAQLAKNYNGRSYKISETVLSKLTWARISYQSLNHAKTIDYDLLNKARAAGTFKYSGSFVVPKEKTKEKEIKKLFSFCKENNIPLRIGVERPCSPEREKQIADMVSSYGSPLLFSNKEHGAPLGCYMAWVRAAIDWHGNLLPCPSMQLTYESPGSLPEDFKLCHISNLEEWLINNKPHDLGYKCSFCNCGKQQNDFIHKLREEVPEHVEFV
jgi:MoaA/NifB/PqqE/SkfB family radical SAM enzyme